MARGCELFPEPFAIGDMHRLSFLELGEEIPCCARVAPVAFQLCNDLALPRDNALSERDMRHGLREMPYRCNPFHFLARSVSRWRRVR